MQRPSESQLESLKKAVTRYHQALPGSVAEEYLDQRGLAPERVSNLRFGFVKDPLPEHAKHEGKLAIPYLRWHPRHGWTVVSIRFRALDDSKPKYASLTGDRPRLYNTYALTQPGLEVGITEGELDAATVTIAGLPTVGVPGATSWQPFWGELFKGYSTVYVFADGDEPGEKLARKIAHELPNARTIHMPKGEDANSMFQQLGEEEFTRLWKQ